VSEPAPLNPPPRRNVTAILTEGGVLGDGTEVEKLLQELNDELSRAAGVEVRATLAPGPEATTATTLHIPDAESARDTDLENAVNEQVKAPLADMVSRHAARVASAKEGVGVLAQAAREEVSEWIDEIERDGAAALRAAIDDFAAGWRKYCPGREEVVREVIKQGIVGTLIRAGIAVARFMAAL
jgi:hypothetical protein